jgi:hypothetical protein
MFIRKKRKKKKKNKEEERMGNKDVAAEWLNKKKSWFRSMLLVLQTFWSS